MTCVNADTKRKPAPAILGKANAKMCDDLIKTFHDHIAYNLRRAAEERGKAADARSERDYRGRIEIAEIFEARAEAALTPLLAQDELEPTLH